MKENWIPLEEFAESVRYILEDEAKYTEIKDVFKNLSIYEINTNYNSWQKGSKLIRFKKEYLISISNNSLKHLPYSILNTVTKGSELLDETIFGKKTK